MATALIYVVVLLVVAALLFVVASALFGRGEELAPIPPGTSPTWLPDEDVGAADVRALRFQQAVRGYRMAEVDWVLDHLAGELERVTADREDLRRRIADLEDPPAADKPDKPDKPGEPAHTSNGDTAAAHPKAPADKPAGEPTVKPAEEPALKPAEPVHAPTEEPTQA